MKEKFLTYFMDIAHRTADLSYAKKLKVGAILVKNGNIIGFSYNGSPSGWDNNAEDKVFVSMEDAVSLDYPELYKKYPYSEMLSGDIIRFDLKTKPEVSHAEENLIMKLSKSTESSDGSSMFVTHNPCFVCSRLIYGAGVKEVYYSFDYRDSSGIDFLRKCGIKVEKICQKKN